MIIPVFDLAQDDEFVTVIIHAPHVKAQDVDFYVVDKEFKFTLPPYFLKLEFPGSLIEDGREHAEYRVDSGDVVVRLPKLVRGEHFADLDLLASLHAPTRRTTTSRPLIEVISSTEILENGAGVDGTGAPSAEPDAYGVRFARALDPEFGWQLPADEFRPATDTLLGRHGYGFDGQHGGFLGNLQRDMRDIVDIEAPEAMSPVERRSARILAEDTQFDEEHYMADFVCDEEIRRLIAFESRAERQLRKLSGADVGDAGDPGQGDAAAGAGGLRVQVKLSDEDRDDMRKLPRKEYIVNDERTVYLGLVDLLFSHAYDHRTTEGDPSVESAWTIAKVSPTLSHLDRFDSIGDVAVACVRRALCFPLYRHFDLCSRILRDVVCALKLGRRGVLQRLLETRRILAQDDSKRVLCSLYLDDYCVWIQLAREDTLASLAVALADVCASLGKGDVGWDLVLLEQAATAAAEEEPEAPQ